MALYENCLFLLALIENSYLMYDSIWYEILFRTAVFKWYLYYMLGHYPDYREFHRLIQNGSPQSPAVLETGSNLSYGVTLIKY